MSSRPRLRRVKTIANLRGKSIPLYADPPLQKRPVFPRPQAHEVVMSDMLQEGASARHIPRLSVQAIAMKSGMWEGGSIEGVYTPLRSAVKPLRCPFQIRRHCDVQGRHRDGIGCCRAEQGSAEPGLRPARCTTCARQTRGGESRGRKCSRWGAC